ncbi:MAG: DUF1311 domain-containing protein [Alphaproteobacteria bacterium]|nr:DUF1311 domain-containing protein [Alphaproteobacteria bacterium]
MKRPSRLFFAGLAAALVASPLASAQTAEDCGNLPGTSTTHDLDLCYDRVYQRADAELNTVYRQLTDRLADPSERELLQQAEEAWVQYRDKECAFETAGTREGTIHPIEVSICLTAKTQAHIEELKQQLDCPEGDPTCMHHKKEGGG